MISIHALLAESDISALWMARSHPLFLSTLSLRRATFSALGLSWYIRSFLSTLSLRRATAHYDNYNLHCVFLSTLSLRRATIHQGQRSEFYAHFYPRSPCGERPALENEESEPQNISIHALLAESDSKPKDLKSRRMVFLSTLSLRRATCSWLS